MARKPRGIPYLQLQDERGNPITKEAKGNALEDFLKKMDDPNYWITIPGSEELQADLVLSPDEIDMIQRIENYQYADADYDPYEPQVEFFTRDVMTTPLYSGTEPKRRSLPSKWEHKKIVKIVMAIRRGVIKIHDSEEQAAKKPRFYDIWESSESQESTYPAPRISAPRVKLPQHGESYNPPSNLVASQKEIEDWSQSADPNKPAFLPSQYEAFRLIPGYKNFIMERFSRCLDLFLCPRALRKRSVIDPETLVPVLPDINELKPFPTKLATEFKGHSDKVRSVSFDQSGNWLLSGSDDGTAKVWEVDSGRCFVSWSFNSAIINVQWNPNSSFCIVAFSSDNKIYLKALDILGDEIYQKSREFLLNSLQHEDDNSICSWSKCTLKGLEDCIEISHQFSVMNFSWHKKGDYLVSVCGNVSQSSVFVHLVSKRKTQSPFKKASSTDSIKLAMFHPFKPHLYVASERNIKVYDLVNSKNPFVKKITSTAKSISCIDIYNSPTSTHLLIGTHDSKTLWFDLEMSATTPYKIMRYHRNSIQSVKFHPRFPFFASCGDDATVQLFYGKVFEDDLMKNPLVVPLHVIRDHRKVDSLGVLCIDFHPTEPWMVTAGADSSLRLYT